MTKNIKSIDKLRERESIISMLTGKIKKQTKKEIAKMSETAPTNNNQEYLEHYPDAVTDVDKANFMAEAELPYRETAAVFKRSAELIGDAIIEGRAQLPDTVLEFAKENAHHANKTKAIRAGLIDADNETEDEELTREAGTALYGYAEIPSLTENMTLDGFFEHRKEAAQEKIDNGKKQAERVGERYDQVKQRLGDIK